MALQYFFTRISATENLHQEKAFPVTAQQATVVWKNIYEQFVKKVNTHF
jgi:hypothetical protein